MWGSPCSTSLRRPSADKQSMARHGPMPMTGQACAADCSKSGTRQTLARPNRHQPFADQSGSLPKPPDECTDRKRKISADPQMIWRECVVQVVVVEYDRGVTQCSFTSNIC